MQIDQVQSINRYRSVMQSAQAAETAKAPQEEEAKQTAAAAEPAASTDRVELSGDSTVWKMNKSDRAALVESLKEDQKNQMDRFVNMMAGIFQKQGITAATAGSDSFWRTIASGNFTVDAETKAAAQQAISEDGYWGVKQTSERIFSMAAALAGDNTELMEKMQAAVEKGFQRAGLAWGGKMPSITDDTHEAINKMFDEYYAANKPESAEDEKTEEAEKAEESEKAEETEKAEESKKSESGEDSGKD